MMRASPSRLVSLLIVVAAAFCLPSTANATAIALRQLRWRRAEVNSTWRISPHVPTTSCRSCAIAVTLDGATHTRLGRGRHRMEDAGGRQSAVQTESQTVVLEM